VAPVHLVHWGDPSIEQDEVGEIRSWLEMGGNPASVQEHRIIGTDPNLMKEAIRAALSDLASQIIYITCHGNLNELLYAEESDISVKKSEFSQWLSEMSPSKQALFPGDEGDFHEICLVFGACETFGVNSLFEDSLPIWVSKIYGFRGKPSSGDVISLASGVIDDLYERGNAASNAMSEGASKVQGLEAKFSAMQAALDKMPQTENPGRLLAKDPNRQQATALAAERNRTGKWERREIEIS